MATEVAATEQWPLEMFACPNPECEQFNQFGAGNLSVVEHIGKYKGIRRLYCNHCQSRFSERKGSLLQDAKLPLPAVVRIVKCLTHGCSDFGELPSGLSLRVEDSRAVQATADICDVDPRTVSRVLRRGGQRADDFHRLQLARLTHPPEAVELDELHAKVSRPPTSSGGKKGEPRRDGIVSRIRGRAFAVVRWAAIGFTPPWT